MARIDGDKIRRLRESKGLTQLYLATVVGVTTDTVSRWENRRYPTIKRDNALKLAEALEVEIDAILEEQETVPSAGQMETEETEGREQRQAVGPGLRRRFLPLLLAVFFLSLALFFWWRFTEQHVHAITAFRELPLHSPPGQPFPVMITVAAANGESFPLILKEILPRDCTVLNSVPEITNTDGRNNEIKWIGRTAGRATIFAYMVQAAPEAPLGRELIFAGAVTPKGQGQQQGDIKGDSTVKLDTFHWADVNTDHKIDDNEILTVYDRYSIIDGLDFDRERIDDIWAAQGYRWDTTAADFVIIP
jgi:transcriptional regulator with XRE-family HTH domain